MLSNSYYFYPTIFAFCLLYYLAAGLAINIGYHRCLSHRSFQLWRPLKYLFITLGLPAGTPIQWIGNHRFHHANADQLNDPHSPVQDGFWHAHVGWYIGTEDPFICFLYSIAGPLRTIYDAWSRPRTNRQHDHLASDISADGYFRLISRPVPFMILCWLHTVFFFGLAFTLWGWTGLAVLWVTLVAIYNFGEAIDSVAHLHGERPFQATHFARNSKWLAIFTLGEGWHANHHVFPYSARHGLLSGQFDAVWLMIRMFERIGVVSGIRIPERMAIEQKMKGIG